MSASARPVLLFDSGMGGLTVLAALRRLMPDLDGIYVADDERFPYGALSEAALVSRVAEIMERLIGEHHPSATVIACNTASTLVLPVLRSRFNCPFIGTVPAIKPAAATSTSRLISVLATPGTVERDYTRALIEEFAGQCEVTLVGAANLAAHAERRLSGLALDQQAIADEIAPAFVERGGLRTDTIVLACTHYPLILDVLAGVGPWPVSWIDPAPAIAHRVARVLEEGGREPGAGTWGTWRILLTSGKSPPPFTEAILAELTANSVSQDKTLTDSRPAAS